MQKSFKKRFDQEEEKIITVFFLEYVHLSVFRQDGKPEVTFSGEFFFLRCNYENNNKGKPITSWLSYEINAAFSIWEKLKVKSIALTWCET